MKAALVTGASRGIGREIAQALGRAGWCVAVQYHENRQMAEETAQNIGTYQAIAVGADMSDPVQASGAVAAAVERYGPSFVDALELYCASFREALAANLSEKEENDSI